MKKFIQNHVGSIPTSLGIIAMVIICTCLIHPLCLFLIIPGAGFLAWSFEGNP
jgi:hypothetical protein